MRESMGLEMRQEFEDAVEVVESKALAPKTQFPADVMERFHATEAELTSMAARSRGLKIAGAADKQGYAAVRGARMELRDARIMIEKTRKAENEEAQAHIKMCNNVAKYLISLTSPTEYELEAEEKRVDAEIETIKAAKQAEAAAALQKRIEALQAVQQPFTLAEITLMTDTQFGFLLATATDAFQAKEKIRIEAEAALAKQEAERLEAERKAAEVKAEAERIEREAFALAQAEQAKAAAELAAEKAKLKAEQDAFEATKREAERIAREKLIAEDAAAKAKAKAEQDAADAKAKAEREAREAKEREARELAETIERAKAAAEAKPDAEKILALAKFIREIALPKLATEAGRAIMIKIDVSMGKFATYLELEAKALSPVTLNAAP